MRKLLFYFLTLLLSGSMITALGQPTTNKKVLVLVEGKYDLKSVPTALGRELTQLLGHFKTDVTINGVNTYNSQDINKYDFVFYVGYTNENKVPQAFCNDVMKTTKPVVWINSGFKNFANNAEVVKRYGFTVSSLEEKSAYTDVKAGNETFTKGTSSINIVKIVDNKKVKIWATATSSKKKSSPTPYMLQSGNLTYVADLPIYWCFRNRQIPLLFG